MMVIGSEKCGERLKGEKKSKKKGERESVREIAHLTLTGGVEETVQRIDRSSTRVD